VFNEHSVTITSHKEMWTRN